MSKNSHESLRFCKLLLFDNQPLNATLVENADVVRTSAFYMNKNSATFQLFIDEELIFVRTEAEYTIQARSIAVESKQNVYILPGKDPILNTPRSVFTNSSLPPQFYLEFDI